MSPSRGHKKGEPMPKIFFILVFRCNACEMEHRYHEMDFDYILMANCTKCGCRSFGVFKRRLTPGEVLRISNKKIIMEEVKKC